MPTKMLPTFSSPFLLISFYLFSFVVVASILFSLSLDIVGGADADAVSFSRWSQISGMKHHIVARVRIRIYAGVLCVVCMYK